ncbi:MAG TPA: hypothetical protein VGH92_10775 [Gaiellaceae bacterium]
MARRLLAVLICAAAVVPAARAATTLTAPVYDQSGHLIQTPFAPSANASRLTGAQALAIVRANHKVHAWLSRYPKSGYTAEETYDATSHQWTVKLFRNAHNVGEVVEATVDDASGTVVSAWTGPQVAWGMLRGVKGAFGGDKINNPWVWGAFCAAFLIGLGNFRRPLSLRNLDLIMLLSPTASLWYFNHGDVFRAVPLFYPALLWVILRGVWIGVTGRGSGSRALWPTWILLAATVFLAGFRVGLNVEASNVIDVGYSGVIGAQRIVSQGQAPWGHFPVEDSRPACGPSDSSGEIRDRVQTNGRCESANPEGDTYGPTAYEAYIPGFLAFGWSGKWDSLPSVHFTSIAFDLLSILGLFLVGLRFGGMRLAATLAFAWAAYPFTQYASNSNTNDAIMPCLLIYGFWLASRPVGRGVFAALSGWSKFATLIVAPLWATYPDRRPSTRFIAGFAIATAAAFAIVLAEPSPIHELRVFWDRTVRWQIGRDSPFSLWDWRQYHARGLPDLHLLQRVLQVVVVLGALVVAVVPRRKSPLQLAALTAALLAGFELVQTYWLYTYIPWFFPFAAITVLAPAALVRERRVEDLDLRTWPVVSSAG